MATINNKFIHFKSKSDFLTRYADTEDGGLTYGDFLGTSIVFIQDAKQIWTHGQFYTANSSPNKLNVTITGANNDSVTINVDYDGSTEELYIGDFDESIDALSIGDLNT